MAAMPFDFIDALDGYPHLAGGGWSSAPTEAETETPYPFYCVLLYTRDPGVDLELSTYVESHVHDLDRMLGDSCLGAALRPTRRKQQRVSRGDVYEWASELDVPPDALPCAVFFTGTEQKGRSVLVQFEQFLPNEERRRDGDINRAFRCIASSLARHSSAPEHKRLDKLERSLKQARRRCFDNRVVSQPSAVLRVADASDAMARTLSNGDKAYKVLATLAVAIFGGGAI